MTTEAKPSSRAGSKTNLNESTMPLLLVEEENKVVHKDPAGKDVSKGSAETFEMKETKGDVEEGKINGESTREPPSKKRFSDRPNFLDELTMGLNLLDRDERRINEPVNLAYGDVIAEPDASHGLEGPWRISFATFTFLKTWLYSFLAAILGVPLSIVWSIVFALITFAHIWLVTPVLRIVDVVFGVIRRLVIILTTTFLEPIFIAIGGALSQIRMTRNVSLNNPSTSMRMSGNRGQQTEDIEQPGHFKNLDVA
jgi:hypothetical protein